MARYHQGRFKPKNPQKYIGDVTNIIYRSSWELKLLKWCDSNPNVTGYNSEELVIPYYSVIDNKNHRYFVDFKIWIKYPDGTTKIFAVEVKPQSQIEKPEQPKRMTNAAKEKILTWVRNQEKWKAAKEFCTPRGMEFIVLNEHDLGIVKKR